MSMTGNFRYVSDAGLALLRARPELTGALSRYGHQAAVPGLPAGLRPQLQAILASVPPEMREEMLKKAMARLQQSGVLGLLQETQNESSEALKAAGFPVEGIGPPLDLQKAWHGLHFLLAGTKDAPTAPPGDAILGGRELGEDLGIGPMRVTAPAQVAATARALAALDPASLRASYDPHRMEDLEIYPGHWDDPENCEWLMAAFAEVRGYFAAAADKQAGMAFWII
jgi:hypothetical protein